MKLLFLIFLLLCLASAVEIKERKHWIGRFYRETDKLEHRKLIEDFHDAHEHKHHFSFHGLESDVLEWRQKHSSKVVAIEEVQKYSVNKQNFTVQDNFVSQNTTFSSQNQNGTNSSSWYLDALGVNLFKTNTTTQGESIIFLADTAVYGEPSLFCGYFGKETTTCNETTAETTHGTLMQTLMQQVNPNVTIVPITVLDQSGVGTTYSTVNGLLHLIDHINATYFNRTNVSIVINLSWSGPKSILLNYVVNNFKLLGVHVVVAYGNQNYYNATLLKNETACYQASPVSAQNVIVVGANNVSGTPADFSYNYSCVSTYAPGVNVLGKSGTSISTALVSASVALATAEKPCYSVAQVDDMVEYSSPNANVSLFGKFVETNECQETTKSLSSNFSAWMNNFSVSDYSQFEQQTCSSNECMSYEAADSARCCNPQPETSDPVGCPGTEIFCGTAPVPSPPPPAAAPTPAPVPSPPPPADTPCSSDSQCATGNYCTN